MFKIVYFWAFIFVNLALSGWSLLDVVLLVKYPITLTSLTGFVFLNFRTKPYFDRMSAALLLSLRVSLFQTPLFHVLPFLADFLKDHGKGLFAAVYQVWSLNQFFLCLLFTNCRPVP